MAPTTRWQQQALTGPPLEAGAHAGQAEKEMTQTPPSRKLVSAPPHGATVGSATSHTRDDTGQIGHSAKDFERRCIRGGIVHSDLDYWAFERGNGTLRLRVLTPTLSSSVETWDTGHGGHGTFAGLEVRRAGGVCSCSLMVQLA